MSSSGGLDIESYNLIFSKVLDVDSCSLMLPIALNLDDTQMFGTISVIGKTLRPTFFDQFM